MGSPHPPGSHPPGLPPPGPHPPGPPARPRRRRGLSPKVVLILLIVGGVLAMTGAGTAFLLYRNATDIDRGTPTVAVHQFLRAVFFDRNDARVELFTCPQWTADRTAGVRGAFDPEVKVSWEAVNEQSRTGGQGVVTARMRLVYQGYVDFQDWRFEVVDSDGWRVCAAGPAPGGGN